MASARRNSNKGHLTVYEQERDEQIAVNNEFLASLGLPAMNMCNEPNKRRKVISYLDCSTAMSLLIFNTADIYTNCSTTSFQRTHNISVEARVHNLRPRTQTSHATLANEQVEEDLAEEDLDQEDLAEDDWECESTGDFLSDNEGLVYPVKFSQIIYNRFSLCLHLISQVTCSRFSQQYTREEEWKRYQ